MAEGRTEAIENLRKAANVHRSSAAAAAVTGAGRKPGTAAGGVAKAAGGKTAAGGRGGKAMPKIPITRPAAGGLASIGVPPSLDGTRATERLVTEIAQSEPPPAPEGPCAKLRHEYPQFTAGVGAAPMSAQDAWAASMRDEARQVEVMSAVAAHSSALYRQAMEEIGGAEGVKRL